MNHPLLEFLLFFVLPGTYCRLKWKVSKTPVLFGNDTVLTCIVPESGCVGRRKWFGGKDNKFLCSEENSVDPKKYELMNSRINSNFDLMIKNFQLSDVQCEYTCSCGFQQYTQVLSLDNTEFIYPPTMANITDNSYKTKEKFYMNVDIQKVYPVPNCTLKYQYKNQLKDFDEDIVVENVHQTNLSSNRSTILSITLSQILKVTNNNCTGHLFLTCQTAMYNNEIMNWTIDLCENKVTDAHRLEEILIGSCSCVVLAVVISIIVCKKNKKQNSSNNDTPFTTTVENNQTPSTTPLPNQKLLVDGEESYA